jgi:hypothetical protein
MSWSPQYNHFTLGVFSIHSVSVLGMPRPDLGLEVLLRPAAAIQALFLRVVMLEGQDLVLNVTARSQGYSGASLGLAGEADL